MKNVHYYLSLSTGLILFTITPVQHGFGMANTEATKDQADQSESAKKTADAPSTKQAQHRHCCPFCHESDNGDVFNLSIDMGDFFDDFEQSIQSSLKQIKQSAKISATLNELLQKTKDQTDKDQYSIQEFTPTEANKYGIKVMLPGYDQKDLNVTVKTTQKEFFAPRNTVHITAKKVPTAPAQTEETKGKEAEEPAVKHFSSNLFSSISYVNGKRKEVMYEDGQLTMDFDLPTDIKIDANNYTMTFENGTLTLIFQTLPDEATLQFSEKKQEEEKKDK